MAIIVGGGRGLKPPRPSTGVPKAPPRAPVGKPRATVRVQGRGMGSRAGR
jgi:hypothetical protein